MKKLIQKIRKWIIPGFEPPIIDDVPVVGGEIEIGDAETHPPMKPVDPIPVPENPIPVPKPIKPKEEEK